MIILFSFLNFLGINKHSRTKWSDVKCWCFFFFFFVLIILLELQKVKPLLFNQSDFDVDTVEGFKHQFGSNFWFQSRVLNQLVPLQCQGCHHFQFIHGEGLTNAVSVYKWNKNKQQDKGEQEWAHLVKKHLYVHLMWFIGWFTNLGPAENGKNAYTDLLETFSGRKRRGSKTCANLISTHQPQCNAGQPWSVSLSVSRFHFHTWDAKPFVNKLTHVRVFPNFRIPVKSIHIYSNIRTYKLNYYYYYCNME